MAGAIFPIATDRKVWRFEDHCAHRPAGISGIGLNLTCYIKTEDTVMTHGCISKKVTSSFLCKTSLSH